MLLRAPLAFVTAITPLAAFGAVPAAVVEPVLLAPEAYAETFTVVADLDDGTYVQAQLAVTNAGPGTAHAACRLLVIAPGREPRLFATTADRSEWSYSADAAALQVRSCSVSARRGLAADLVLDGAVVQLRLSATPRPQEPPGHRVGGSDPDAPFYEGRVLVPFSEVSVYLGLPHVPPRVLRGQAYADHSRSTILPADLARGWLRFRGLRSGDCSTLLLARLPPNASTPSAWVWQRSRGAPLPLRLGALPLLGDVERPQQTLVLASSLGELRLTLNAHLFRHAPLEELGFVGSLIGSWTGSVVTHTYRAALAGIPGCDDVPGILELQRVGK